MSENLASPHDVSDPDVAYRMDAAARRHYGGGEAVEHKRKVWPALFKGLKMRCPKCGKTSLFKGYLSVKPECEACGCELHHHQADDAPPYFTIFIVGHLIVPLALVLEETNAPPIWVHWSIWIPMAILLSLALLPPIKGALVGLQWAMRMHGFAGAQK
ncbi:MAG: DUF983 domain-containing protein [Pseudomonadota bacterium]